MAVGVFDGDEILYENYFGFANKAENLHVDADTVFEWGQCDQAHYLGKRDASLGTRIAGSQRGYQNLSA